MNESFFTEATMNDSYIYQMFNVSGEMQTRIVKALQEGIVLDRSYIEEQLLQIEKTRLSPIYHEVITAFLDGAIRLVYWKSTTQKMTKALPFIVHKTAKGPVASIFISSFGRLTAEDKLLDIQMKNLYTLMEAAYIALYLQTHPKNGLIGRNTVIMKVMNSMYVNMMLRILNRDYALSLETSLYDQVAFCASVFFLQTQWGVDNESLLRNYALGETREANISLLDPVFTQYMGAGIKTIEDLFTFFKTLHPRLVTVSTRYYAERFLNTYGGSSILSVDYLPYLFFVTENTLLGSFLVNQTNLSDIAKNIKDVRRFYPELTKIFR